MYYKLQLDGGGGGIQLRSGPRVKEEQGGGGKRGSLAHVSLENGGLVYSKKKKKWLEKSHPSKRPNQEREGVGWLCGVIK